jgi:hypothetical protein
LTNHFSTIGFRVQTKGEFLALAEETARTAETLAVEGGQYLCWKGGSGEEVWLQTSTGRDLMGMNPHFSGRSEIRVGLTSRVTGEHDTPLDGAFHAWANPVEGAPDKGDYPFVFDVPDMATYRDLGLPCVATAQIAAFAHEIAWHDSDEAYLASQKGAEAPLASRAFIPSGLFSSDGPSQPPTAHAVLAGHVVEAREIVNPVGRAPFYWALVETYGGRYDVVVDAERLTRAPRAGNVLSGSFWLSGRLLAYPRSQAKPSWYRRLFRGSGA